MSRKKVKASASKRQSGHRVAPATAKKSGNARVRRAKPSDAIPRMDGGFPEPARMDGEHADPFEPPESQDTDTGDGLIQVVGIGASAGGLEALTRLLRRIPTDSGMAFVIVQHLDPKHESLLPELLARTATVPVERVEDGMRVHADRAFVIPPNTRMHVQDGHLKLLPRSTERGAPMPIDDFFHSLAAVHGSETVGVVMSGSGSDGSAGVAAIKAAGGLTFAQEPSTARHRGMPDSAIATGAVDFVLSPEEIAAHIERISRHPLSQAQPGKRRAPLRDTERIIALLAARTGVDFAQYKRPTVQRRLLRRMLFHKLDSPAAYVERLRGDEAELDALYEDLLIGVSRFFRDPPVFEALSRLAIPALLERRPRGTPVRVWIAGCSGGEETYSMAITMCEALGSSVNRSILHVFATDLNESAIARARAGLYPDSIENEMSPERLRKYFTHERGGYRINKSVRDLCVFARHNLLSDPPFSQVDLISCRNVLIYLSAASQRRIFPLFHYALREHGVLVLGTAESIGSAEDLFVPMDKKNRIFARRSTTHRVVRALPLDAPLPAPQARALRRSGARTPATVLDDEADRIVLDSHAPAGIVIDDHMEVVRFRGRTSRYLAPASGNASLNALRLIRPELGMELHNGVLQARTSGEPTSSAAVLLTEDDGKQRGARLEVIPLVQRGGSGRHFIVLFRDVPRRSVKAGVSGKTKSSSRTTGSARTRASLERELADAKRFMQAIVEDHETASEELRAASEELQSSNEELQSSNEELETAKEEIQSTNEELTTVNEELRSRNNDLSALNSDLANVLSVTSIPVVIVGRDLRIRRFTPAADRILKVITGDIGRPLSDLALRVDVTDLNALILESIDSLAVISRDVRDESGRWYAMQIRPYRTVDQRIDGAVLVFFDVDVERRRTADIDAARVYAESIVETVRQPLVIVDAELKVQSANDAFRRFFSHSAQSVEGRGLTDLGIAHEWQGRHINEWLADSIAGRTAAGTFRMILTSAEAGPRVMSLDARRLRFSEEREPLLLVAFDDVTASHRATAFLADASREFGASLDFAATLEALEDLIVPELADEFAVFLTDSDADGGGVLTGARAHSPSRDLRAFVDRQMELEPHARVFFIAADAERAVLLSNGAAEPGGESPGTGGARLRVARELQLLGLDSILVVPLIAASASIGLLVLGNRPPRPPFDEHEISVAEEFARRAALALATQRNLAARQTAEHARLAAVAANQSKTEFLAMMSHELRTPLNAILGYVRLLEMELHGPVTSAQREDLDRIVRSQRVLASVIGQILEYAKLESGHVAYTLTTVDVRRLLTDVAEQMEAVASTKAVTFRISPGTGACIALADAPKVEQILLNLLSNAVKFSRAESVVELACNAAGERVTVTVRDDGPGIPDDRLEVIFEPFTQIESGLTRRTEGTGLGLPISRQLARGMGGDVTAESSGGVGSTFTLSLPKPGSS